MNKDNLNKKLIKACFPAKLEEIQKLVTAGADPNLKNEYGESIFAHAFMCEGGENAELVKAVVNTLVNHGWDIKKYGLKIMHQFVYMSDEKSAFDLIRFFLKFDLGDDRRNYENLLESIGTEESYQRCCENNHNLESLYYAMYEIVEAKMNNLPYEHIKPYYGAVGKKIDKILYFGKDNLKQLDSGYIEYNGDIGLVSGEEVLVIRPCVNILFINNITDTPHVETPELFGDGVIGSTIVDISFEHREIVKEKSHYGQPTIVLFLDNGKKLNFTHNFGELPGRDFQARFFVTDSDII